MSSYCGHGTLSPPRFWMAHWAWPTCCHLSLNCGRFSLFVRSYHHMCSSTCAIRTSVRIADDPGGSWWNTQIVSFFLPSGKQT
jgi:hypothetical protein